MFAFNTLNNEALPIYLKISLAVSSEQQMQTNDLRKSTKNGGDSDITLPGQIADFLSKLAR